MTTQQQIYEQYNLSLSRNQAWKMSNLKAKLNKYKQKLASQKCLDYGGDYQRTYDNTLLKISFLKNLL